jgi:hypothetical protein
MKGDFLPRSDRQALTTAVIAIFLIFLLLFLACAADPVSRKTELM